MEMTRPFRRSCQETMSSSSSGASVSAGSIWFASDSRWNQRTATTVASIHHNHQVLAIKEIMRFSPKGGTSSFKPGPHTTKVSFPSEPRTIYHIVHYINRHY